MGSGMVPKLGFMLQDRGNYLISRGKAQLFAPRPFHTIIPAFVLKIKTLYEFWSNGRDFQTTSTNFNEYDRLWDELKKLEILLDLSI
jgi:gamma-glutamyltranspeptidase